MIVLCWIGILLLSGMAFSDVKTYNIGETAILNCIIGSHNATLDWIQYPVGSSHLPQLIYNTRFGFEPAYKSGGRHAILQYSAFGSRDLSITNLNFNDSGSYVCSNSRGSAYRTTELTVTDLNLKCGSNVSLDNVLVENDCGLDPDIIQASCSVGYRGNQPPSFNWYYSGNTGIVELARIHNTTDGKTATSSLIVNAVMQLNQTFFSCEVNTNDQQTRVKCSMPKITVSYVFNDSLIRITEGQQDSYECIANTSQNCTYEWLGKYSTSPYNLFNASGQTIQLQNIDVLRCIANCSLRNSSCLSVSSTFAEQSVGISASNILHAIVLPVLGVVSIFVISIFISIFIRQCKKRRNQRRPMREPEQAILLPALPEESRVGNDSPTVSPERCSGNATDLLRIFHDRAPIENAETAHTSASNSGPIFEGQISQDREILESDESQNTSLTISDPVPVTKTFNDHFTTIKNNLDPRYGFLDQLLEKGILSLEKFTEISSALNPEECCHKLLVYLMTIKNTEKPLAVFKDVLKKDHSWIYNMIWLNPEDVINKNDRPLSEDERLRIFFNNRCLVKLIDPYKHDFLSQLVEKKCITFSHFQKLTAMGEVVKSEMISELFTILLRRSFVHFQSFIQCLKFTLQHNLVQILESNGVVLDMQINLQNSKLEKHIVDILTGTVELDDLGVDKQMVDKILKALTDKGLIIIGGSSGSLIVYILLLSSNAVNEMENLYKTKELENTLNTVTKLDVTIKIDDGELPRCRRFFSELHNSLTQVKCIEDHRVRHCGMLNEMPSELFEMILEQASWMLWVCFLINSLQTCSLMPVREYLTNGIQGFSKFVEVSSADIFRRMSSVCRIWRYLIEHKRYGKSIKSKLLSKIAMIAIKRSKKVIIENLDLQDGSLELFLSAELITDDDRTDCESLPGKTSNEMFLGFLYRDKKQIFVKLKKFLMLLEKQRKSHLINHVISLGVYWLNFEKRWPLDEKSKVLISTLSEAGNCVNIETKTHEKSVGEINISEHTSSRNLVSLLLEHKCITPEKEKLLNQTTNPEKNWQIMKLLANGSIEMFEIAIDYFKETGQHGVVDWLQPNQEVLKYGKHIVNCLHSSSEILDRMVENSIIASPIRDHFLTKDHPSYFNHLNRFQQNEIVLNILECSPPDVYSYFLNSLLATKQPLLPMFRTIPHSELIRSSESYLIDSIGIDTELLLNMLEFNVIDDNQKETIESKGIFIEKCKELWRVVSESTPKSFNLALAALVKSGRPNILENMQIITDSDELCDQNTSVVEKPVESPPDVEQMEKKVEVETKISSGLVLNKFTPLSRAKSFIIRNKASLPDDIQNLLLLKVVAIEQLPSVDVHSLSRNLSSLLKYVSNNSSNILQRKITLPTNTLQANLSIIFKPKVVAHRQKMEDEIIMKLVVKHFHEELTMNIDPLGDILQMLVKEKVLTSQQKTKVESMPNSELRSEKLLWILYVAEHDTACSVFVETLEKDYPKLFQIMDLTSFLAYQGKVQPEKEPEALNDMGMQSDTDNEERPIPLNKHGIGTRIQCQRVEYDLSINNGETVKYEGVETSESHPTNISCKVLKKRGVSSIKFKLFDVPENIQVFMVRVQLTHCRAESSGSVSFFVNDDMVIRKYDSAPFGIFGAQQFLIPSTSLKVGTNWFTIVFDSSNSDGEYCLSDIAVDYSYIQVRDGKLNNTTISTDFKFDFSGEVTGAQFTNVLNQDYYRKIKPYKFFNDRGNSRVVIKFNIKDDDSTSLCWLVVLLHHCRTNGEASVNLYVNNVPLHLNLYPIPRDNFIDEKFIIQRELLFVGKNTLTIELSKDSHGVYWLSNVVIKVVCFKPTIEP